MNKEQREEILIELYQKWIHPKLISSNFPYLSREDILKIETKKHYKELYEKGLAENPNMDEDHFKKLFEKKYGKRPESLISREGWFLVSDQKEKDVFNIHYSFGFTSKEDDYWIEIALNSVSSVEQFLSMNDKEIKEFFELAKNKPPRMTIELTKKTKPIFSASVDHELIFEREMYKLGEKDTAMIRMEANKINNLRDPLVKPFIGICTVKYLKKEELAENFAMMEDIFNFLKGLIPRRQRYKNEIHAIREFEERKEVIEAQLPHRKKVAELMKNLSRFNDQEKIEKDIIKLEHELEEINKSLQDRQRTLITIKQDLEVT